MNVVTKAEISYVSGICFMYMPTLYSKHQSILSTPETITEYLAQCGYDRKHLTTRDLAKYKKFIVIKTVLLYHGNTTLHLTHKPAGGLISH